MMMENSTSNAISRWSLFGPPPILEGEDAAAYDELVGRICAAVKPVDVIDEMFMADVAASEWEVLRWRRLKLSLIRARALKALEGFLRDKLDYDLYREHFVDELTTILQGEATGVIARDFAGKAQTLAHECARNEPGAVDKVTSILADMRLEMKHILQRGKTRKAKELTQQYVRRESDAVEFIDKHLATAGVSIETLTAEALAQDLGYIERIDRLANIAEARRNASLHEIDRRRPILGETLRRSVQEVEDSEVIETTPAKGEALLDERPQDQS